MLALRQLRLGSGITRLISLANGCPAATGAVAAASEQQVCGEGRTAALAPAAPAPAGGQGWGRTAWSLEQVASMSKAAKQKGGKKGGAAPAAATGGSDAATFDITATKQLMARSVEHLQHELANIRTGRATPGMLDHLRVDVYGEKMPLKACGTVLVRDPQLLAISVFDPSTLDAIQKAIRDSPLQLNPKVEGQEVLVPIPRPTAETLAAMMKVCKAEAEQAKVSVRHARKVAMDEVKRSAPSEDERHRVEKEVQKLTDEFIAEVDRLVAEKEKSITLHAS